MIELQEILLRPPCADDAKDIFEYGSDHKVAYYTDWTVRTDLDSIIESIKERERAWKEGNEFYWVLVHKSTNKVIGGIACSINQHAAEIGYLLNKEYWNRGYATEAAKAIIQLLLKENGIYRIWATCDIENISSCRVLEKIGMQQEGILRKFAVRPNISNTPRDAFIYSMVKE